MLRAAKSLGAVVGNILLVCRGAGEMQDAGRRRLREQPMDSPDDDVVVLEL